MVNQGLSEYAVCSQYTADYASNLNNILGVLYYFWHLFANNTIFIKGRVRI